MSILLVPGQPITAESGYLRGHGTYFAEPNVSENPLVDESAVAPNPVLTASIAGEVIRVNRLLSVRPLKQRFTGEVGDLVVGRITAVDSKRWRVDISGQRDAQLQLSSVSLPGGAQRIRTYEDQLAMRQLFAEGDLICAEIQQLSADGGVSLHTRSLKYGKLANGHLVRVPANLVRRLPQHFITLPSPVNLDLLLGKNGWLWIVRTIPQEWKLEEADYDEVTPLAETLERLKARHERTPYTAQQRMDIARLQNVILALAKLSIVISPETCVGAFKKSMELNMSPKDLLTVNNMERIVNELQK